MIIIRNFINGVEKFFNQGNAKYDLNTILSNANPKVSLEERVDWIQNLLIWIRSTEHIPIQFDPSTGQIHTARVRFILQLLDRNIEWKKAVSETLRSVIKETKSLQLFCHTGLPQEVGFLQEATDRMVNKIIPTPPDDTELSELFLKIFPNEEDAIWVSNLTKETIEKIKELIQFEAEEGEKIWKAIEEDIEDAIYVLVSQIHAMGLSDGIRRRISNKIIKDSPFIGLSDSIDIFLHYYRKKNNEKMIDYAKLYRQYILECKKSVQEVFQHLDEFGVSVALVYQLEKITFHLSRLEVLLAFLNPVEKQDNIEMIPVFLSRLIRESLGKKSVVTLIQTNLNQMSRKIAEQSGKTGEHYITSNKEEYVDLLKSASGGGILMAFATTIKFIIVSIKLPHFFEGFFASINYASTFVFIQLLGFTVATKQPSMTAACMAGKLNNTYDEESLNEFVDEVVKLTRSQFAAIVGNLALVFPVSLLIDFIYKLITGNHFIDEGKAINSVLSISIFGSSIFFAIFTGFLLWVSSVIAGWVQNWSIYRRLPEAIENNKRLIYVMGRENSSKLASFFLHNISGFGGNISLGFLLGMTPVVGMFFGIPLEVRHVTLSTGSFAFALSSLGLDGVQTIDLVFACLGIVAIGFLNVVVSFSLALSVAIRARKVQSLGRKRVRAAIIRRLRKSPIDFIFPLNKK
ncbi:site-specific recombinase [Fluviispira multicolorata]|uniref:site-specific recombinase n=1 Tax=Fluviispira multicolorata TaxID=2654512 RepID=UPI00137573E2|nr:site-specific recombinase [Fluviispira multicolorata]